ncbi:uncharacterized protein yc1106_08758 [Curvularia clavata]|uniref:Heterokaryon incompatibility domain-containing protein n=1 Tax=Curvularia clavata TaxID=95742 RepID=A0A9Q8ZHB7_CURCL|nr:uncharacterized protein yc1106_08758 [Curvularia clavata]
MEHLGLRLPDRVFDVTYEGNLYTEEQTKHCHFHGFVENQGWTFDPVAYEVKSKGMSDERELSKYERTAFPQLMQSWLFFGLIAAVVYDDFDNSREFQWTRLLSEDENKINTAQLSQMLEEWRRWEMRKENKAGQNMRMIRAQLALDVAKLVVKNHSPTGRARKGLDLDDNLALSLMILGETLTSAKAKIIEQVGFKARDWYGDASIGWGIPLVIMDKMDKDSWCPRTKKLLTAQLRKNATALLSVYISHREQRFEGHENCDENEPCKRKSEDRRFADKYATKHHPMCLHDRDRQKHRIHPCHPETGCCVELEKNQRLKEQWRAEEDHHTLPTCRTPCTDMVGVEDMEEVVKIIMVDRIPLLRFKDTRSNEIKLEVIDSATCQDYATISHVWSDGYGNPDDNKLWRCQLAYFRDLLIQAQTQRNRQSGGGFHNTPKPLPFWIDTLAIPVSDEYKSARKKAVSQIYKVYSRARYTIVIDNGLSNMAWDHQDYTTTAMRILASGWMRRLWTLQEAYLSRKLLFAFERKTEKIPLIDLDEIEELYVDTSDKLVSSLPSNARSYYHNMLGQDRKARIHGLTSTNSVGLVASVWRAAQWRTTSKKEHETLALATLLNLDYKNHSFAGGDVLKQHDDSNKKLSEYEKKLMEYMKDFWTLLEENSPGAIPPGIIFLPGDRIQLKGFGWAPRSWMEAREVGHPDPIAVVSKSAKLDSRKRGLLVEFPGFLLHCQLRKSLTTYTSRDGFWFPTDSSLSEWYHVKPADGQEYSTKKGIVSEERSKDLAIILSRPRPRETPEIGLLVEIEQMKVQRELGKESGKRIFEVYILARMEVKRETDKDHIDNRKLKIINSRREDYRDSIMCGEVLEEDQQWYVDSRPSVADDIAGSEDADAEALAEPLANNASTLQSPIGFRIGAASSVQMEREIVTPSTLTQGPTPSTRTIGGSSTHEGPPASIPQTHAFEGDKEKDVQEAEAPSIDVVKRRLSMMETGKAAWKRYFH